MKFTQVRLANFPIHISLIFNVTFIFKNFEMYFQKGKKMEIFMDSEKSMNSFEIKMDRLLHCLQGNIFTNFLITF